MSDSSASEREQRSEGRPSEIPFASASSDMPGHSVHPSSPSMEEIDREVREAMAAMNPADIAELGGRSESSESRSTKTLDPHTVQPGTELVGTIVGFSDDEIFLELDAKSQGVIPRSHFGKKETLEIGRRVDVMVDRYDEDSGLILLARKGSAIRATWTNLTIGMIVEGRVTGMNKGGLEVDLKGVRAFLPGSQVDLHPMRDISTLIGQAVRCEVMELDRRNKNVLLSRRKLLEKDRAEAREKLKTELEVGQVRRGVVGNLTEFGAFVDLGGIDGLIHIRDMSWGQVDKVSDFLTPGQEVEVKVLRIDGKRERISLGLKHAQPDPWLQVPDKYAVGTTLRVRVVRLADFGAFAEVEPGVEGLIPISEMGWQRTRSAGEAVSVGSVVDAKIIRLEMDKRRMALSMKQAQPDPWAGVLDGFTENSQVRGKVTRLAAFGAFVEIAPGVEGLIHISELSDRRVKSTGEVVDVGQEVEVRVLGVDKENRRISLSLRPATSATSDGASSHGEHPIVPAKSPKKRKKELRGGLSSSWEW